MTTTSFVGLRLLPPPHPIAVARPSIPTHLDAILTKSPFGLQSRASLCLFRGGLTASPPLLFGLTLAPPRRVGDAAPFPGAVAMQAPTSSKPGDVAEAPGTPAGGERTWTCRTPLEATKFRVMRGLMMPCPSPHFRTGPGRVPPTTPSVPVGGLDFSAVSLAARSRSLDALRPPPALSPPTVPDPAPFTSGAAKPLYAA